MTGAIIPAFNEEERIATTVAAVCGIPDVDQVIVVDDGSLDLTARRASEAGADVLRLAANRGKGAALNAGARASRADIFLLLDADLGDSAAEAVKLLQPVRDECADMTIATFPPGHARGGGFGWVVRLARRGIREMTGLDVSAPLSGQRALRREVWERIGGFEEGFGAEVGLTIDAARAGFRILEVETEMTHRITGRDLPGFRHRGRQYLAVLRALRKRRRQGR